MATVIAVLVIVAILAAAITYIVREKKKGVKCIGCPYAQNCGSHGHCASHDHQ